MKSDRFGINVLALCIVLSGTLSFLFRVVGQETARYKYDFACYYATWYAARHGQPIYEDTVGENAGNSAQLEQIARLAGVPGDVPSFVYSPAFAALGCILPPLPYRSAELWAVWINGVLWIATVSFLAVVFCRDNLLVAAGLCVLAWFFPPALFTLSLGQVNIIIFALLALALWGLQRGHDKTAGLVLACVLLCKVQLGLLLVYLLLRRRWWAIAACVVGLAISVAFSVAMVGWAPWLSYFQNILPAGAGGMAYIANQAFPATILRWFIDDPRLLFTDAFLASDGWFWWLGKSVSVVVVLSAGYILIRCRRIKAVAMEFAFVVLTLLLASPISTIHHFTWAFLAVTVLWSTMLADGLSWRCWQQVILLVGTLLLFLPWQNFFGIFLGQTGWPRFFACNTCIGTLLLWGIAGIGLCGLTRNECRTRALAL